MTKLHPQVPAWVVSAPEGVQRRFLFLQGPIGTFFDRLANQLRKKGHEVHRVHFNGGDRFFCSGRVPSTDFCDTQVAWPQFLKTLLAQQRITDIVLFGDCRPLHRSAIDVAELRQIPVHVFEEGYLRPNWLTLEIGGVNRHSPLSRDPQWYLDRATKLPPWNPGKPVCNKFHRRACEDVLYQASTLLRRNRFAGYKTHRPWSPQTEYWSGAKRFFFIPLAKRQNAQLSRQLIRSRAKFFLFPLQLEADAQIRFHSPMKSMVPAIERIVQSFANHAPADHRLVVTEHPLDTGVVDLKKVTLDAATRAGIRERLIFMHCGSSEELVRKSSGVVTVNSTIGFVALDIGIPVKTIGHAVYDIPRLTFQGKLDQFWKAPTEPDRQVFDSFRRVVAIASQINGGLYSREAVELAVESASARLSADVTQRWLDWGLDSLPLSGPTVMSGAVVTAAS